MLGGMQDTQTHIGNFDNTSLVNMSQKDDIIETHGLDEWILLAHSQKEQWKNILVKVGKQDIHVMNKRAFERVIPKLMETLSE